jgi:hypothetical protein
VVASKEFFGYKWMHPQSCGCIHAQMLVATNLYGYNQMSDKKRVWMQPHYQGASMSLKQSQMDATM